MKTLSEILEAADNNGFDNFGLSGWEYRNTTFKTSVIYELEDEESVCYSLADLATNKSFLEAMVKAKGGLENKMGFLAMVNHIHWALCGDLLHNYGKDFAKICSKFIGGDSHG